MSRIELSVLRRHSGDGDRRLRRVAPLVTAAALSASLVAGAAAPASAAVRQPARTAPVSLASSDNALPAASFVTTSRYVHATDGRFTFDTPDAARAGVSSQTLSTESALVADLNKLLDRETAPADSASDGAAVDLTSAVPAAAQNTTITLLPGITLTIDKSTGIQLSMTKQAVTEVENLAGFGQSVASLVGAILAVAQVPAPGPQIASLVAASLAVGSSFLKLCTASDGSATFTVPWFGLPSCSGFSLVA